MIKNKEEVIMHQTKVSTAYLFAVGNRLLCNM